MGSWQINADVNMCLFACVYNTLPYPYFHICKYINKLLKAWMCVCVSAQNDNDISLQCLLIFFAYAENSYMGIKKNHRAINVIVMKT